MTTISEGLPGAASTRGAGLEGSHTVSPAEWWRARQAGVRLPEHEVLRLPADRAVVARQALREVTLAAQLAEQAPDTDAARQALWAVRDACVRAADLINTAEHEARQAALESHRRVA